MTNLFTIELTINLSSNSRLARQLLNLYFTDMPVDINTAAFELCDANEAVQALKFAKLTMKRSSAWSSLEGGLKVFVLLTVSGEDSTFIKQVIAKYMDDFPDYLKKAGGIYFSHTGFPSDISLVPTDWNTEVR
jgi:hypothetical protein